MGLCSAQQKKHVAPKLPTPCRTTSIPGDADSKVMNFAAEKVNVVMLGRPFLATDAAKLVMRNAEFVRCSVCILLI